MRRPRLTRQRIQGLVLLAKRFPSLTYLVGANLFMPWEGEELRRARSAIKYIESLQLWDRKR